MNQNIIQLELPQVMAAVAALGLDTSLCTMQLPSGALTDSGFPVTDASAWVDVVGLVDIPCQIAPNSVLRVQASTVKTIAEQESLNSNHVLLYGYYPAVETVWRNGGRAVINGNIYPNDDIMGVESDSQQTQTRMTLRVVSI
jgi:hypothetical protein